MLNIAEHSGRRCGTFDSFGIRSHFDYKGILDEQYDNRMILRDIMTSYGFKPLEEEWQHFTIGKVLFPDTYSRQHCAKLA